MPNNSEIKIKKVPNQWSVRVQKSPTGNNFLFSQINQQAAELASQTLTSQYGFNMWYYIASNQDGYKFGLSKEDFCRFANCKEKGYRSARDDLVENGYLVLTDAENNCYDFRDWGNNFNLIQPNIKKEEQSKNFKF